MEKEKALNQEKKPPVIQITIDQYYFLREEKKYGEHFSDVLDRLISSYKRNRKD